MLIGLLSAGPLALAAESTTGAAAGNTSGPAAGSTVMPSTAVQKQNTMGATDKSHAQSPRTQAEAGGMAAGAPGMTAKPGTEAGPAPNAPSGNAANR